MSQSMLTVIGGQGSTVGLTGLVTIPSGFTGSVITSLQSLLTAASGAVSTHSANFENLGVAGQSGAQTATVGGSANGVLVVSNTDSVGNTVAGSANISLNIPTGYSALVVEAPGSETISGNGAAGFLGVFGANSSVNFNTNGGNGSIYGAGPDNVVLVGSAWSFDGASTGGDTVASIANNSSMSVAGSGTGSLSNIVSSDAPNASISSAGTKDLLVIYGGTALVSMAGGGTTLVDGGAVTVSAAPGNSGDDAFFDSNGGQLDFINNSTVAASVFGAVAGAVGGSATVFGGVGGGYFQGGPGGNNSLIGGTGSVTLIGGGTNSYLQASGANNGFFAGGGTTTMIGAAGSGSNLFSGGTGSLMVSTSGSAAQTFFVGVSGQENITGSTVSGAVNSYYFLQDSTGSGSDIIQNFRVGTDHIYINPFGNAATEGVTVAQVDSIRASASHPSGGSLVYLSDNTTIELFGVNAGSIQSDIGKTSI